MNASPGTLICGTEGLGEAGTDDSAEEVIHDDEGRDGWEDADVGGRGNAVFER
jgi:hypothetical protein